MLVRSSHAAACWCAVMLGVAACGDEVTRVELEIVARPDMHLDELRLVVDDEARTIPVTERLTLAMPDEWSGTWLSIDVAGWRSGTLIATGATEVKPIHGGTVPARVHLVDATCPQACSVGETRCDRDGVVTCELGADGCPSWGTRAACTASEPFCSNGACAATCADECQPAAMTCDGTLGTRACAEHDSDPCRDWGPTTACGSDQVCAGDRCTAAAVLTVTRAGAGSGSVSSVPAGVACGATCAHPFAIGTMVTLSAVPSAGSTFAGWSGGGCAGTGPCTLSLGATTTVTATFSADAAACPTSCAAQTLDSSARVTAMVLDATHLYFTDQDADVIFRVTLATGDREVFADAAAGVSRPRAIAIDATHVYWADQGTWQIKRRRKTGGAVEPFGAGVGEDYRTVLVDASHVYFEVHDFSETKTGFYRRATSGSGAVETLGYNSALGDLTLDATSYYYTNSGTAGGSPTLTRVPKAGGSSVPSGSLPGFGYQAVLHSDGTHAYWSGYLGARRLRLLGGVVETLEAGNTGTITTDATRAYWSMASDAQLNIRLKSGGPIVEISLQDSPAHIAVDGSYAYVSYANSAGLDRIPLCVCAP